MIEIANKLVPASELRRVTADSYEHKIESVSEIVLEHLREKVFGERPIEIVATYPTYAVVHAAGAFHKVGLRESDAGRVHVTGVSPIEVEVFDLSESSKFAAKEADAVVDLFFRGSVDSARDRLKGLVPIVLTDRRCDEAKVVESVEVMLQTNRPWRSLFNEKGSYLKRFILDELEELEEHRLRPKFQVLYEGSVDGSELSGYDDLVEEDLEIVLDRLVNIRETTEAAFNAAHPLLEQTGDDEVFPMYESFAEDLLKDLAVVHERASKAAFEIENVSCRGKLRDTLAEAIHPYEVAGRFVVAVAERLTATQ